MCGVFNILMVCCSSCRWFVLCLAYVTYLGLVQVSGGRDRIQSLKPVYLNENRAMDNVQKHTICSYIFHYSFFHSALSSNFLK
jgi:hypothetical protein